VRKAKEAKLSLDDFYEEMTKASNIPLGRFGRSDEFADLAAFLLSSRASYITGVGVSIDGGMSPVI
jgi:NAD(P)-dependent dehydrogenase (short-subunit alcohol dehydrogenase family)